MRKVTAEQIIGAKFERWFEVLLRENGHYFVRRNITYHRSRYHFRQVDVEFKELHWNPLVIVELKYSTRGNVGLHLRRIPHKAGQQRDIRTLLDEAEERREFVKARKAVIATNQHFTGDLHHEASHYPKIELYERPMLERMDHHRRSGLFSFGARKTLEEQIKSTSFRMEYLRPKRIYL